MRRRRGNVPDGCPLSRKELEAVCAIASGQTYKQIAAATGRSASTIRAQLHSAYARLGVVGGTQAAIHCWKHGWIIVDGLDASIPLTAAPPPRIPRCDQVTPEQALYLEAFQRWLATSSDADNEEARVLLRIVRRKGSERRAR